MRPPVCRVKEKENVYPVCHPLSNAPDHPVAGLPPPPATPRGQEDVDMTHKLCTFILKESGGKDKKVRASLQWG